MYRIVFKPTLKNIYINFSSLNSIKIWLNKNKGGSVYLKPLNNNITNLFIDNSQFHNCLTGEMFCQLDDCINTLEKDPPKALILSSLSGSFCSGASIQFVNEARNSEYGENFSKFMQATNHSQLWILSRSRSHLLESGTIATILYWPPVRTDSNCRHCRIVVIIRRHYHGVHSPTRSSLPQALSLIIQNSKQNVVRRIETLPTISVALIEGVAYGGGAELLLCCDFRFIAENGKISFKHRQMGIVPSWGGCHRLIRLIGKQEALKLLLTTEIVNANNALQKGLVDTILVSSNPDERRTEAVNALNSLVEEIPKSVLFAIKKVVVEVSNLNTGANSDIERNILKSVWGKEDHLYALSKFTKNK